ncbi:MAG TPA: right-handed parallel beta-helix repeat-containing protein [Phycisphaerae bacterium]|nr:right-handed parallel beta-helix repeat-containing protein [Phycisphaerae bacterium]HRY71206.1 right-handed parallel beta-helix repeat-containing protein [Phycisphaerae bacterium]HSA29589.1 right-handed parallel beta-helix repeat-containing protein [Phycisphaerae bacterium]
MTIIMQGVPALLFGLGLLAGTAADAPIFHVAPDGRDSYPGTSDKPFKTITKARDAVRAVNASMTSDITVILHGGTYPIDQTLLFEPKDSGTGGHQVVYKAQPSETPVISGGKKIEGWEQDSEGKRWKARTDVPNFRQLHVNGKRAIRAQGPPPNGITLHGQDGYMTATAEMANWRNPTDIEFCYLVVWAHSRCKVAQIAKDGDHAVILMLQPWFTMARKKEGVNVELPSHLENALELLDEPGEWYLDRSEHVVFYMPRPGEDIARAEVIVPVVEKLVEVRGTLDTPVSNIRFEDLTFSHADWLRPSEVGHVDLQANFTLAPGKSQLARDNHMTMVHNEAIKSPAHVVCRATRGVAFERCTFTKLSGAGIDLEFGAQDNVVNGCHFFDVGGSPIQIGDVLKDDHHPNDPRKTVRGNAVTHCTIHDCAGQYKGGVGIFGGYTQATRIAHNVIFDMPYSAISLGWGWGEEDAGGGAANYFQPYRYDTPTPARDNRIEFNHIHHVMQLMNDGGAIYTLGSQPGTVIQGNHLHDCQGSPGGIYLDEGSGFIEVTGNLMYRVPTAINYNNRAQDRIKTCKEHGNYFNPTGLATLAPGKKGNGLNCDGKGASYEVPHSDDLEPETMTVEAWIWAEEIPAGNERRRWIVNKNTHEFTESHYALMIDGDKAGAYINIGGDQSSCFEAWGPAAEIKAQQWHHLAMSYDGKTLKVYLDGRLVASKGVNRKRSAGTTSLVIGRRQDGYVTFKGIIDEVRLYNRALPDDEIRANMQGAAVREGLVAQWTFDEPVKTAAAVLEIIVAAGPELAYRKDGQ